MKVKYTKLIDKLKANGITQKEFKAKAGIGGTTMTNLVKNESVTIETICKICDYFQCMPDEIMEFIPDADYDIRKKKKEDLEKQIKQLQNELKSV